VKHTIGAMRHAFPEASVQAPTELVETLDNDAKERHVATPALAADADAILMLNVADFVSRLLGDANIEILAPRALFGRVLDEFPDVLAIAVDHMADQ
jgi:hypothetical protein